MFSHVQLFATPWTEVCQAPLSMEFSRQEYWSRVPFPSLGYLPDPGVEPSSLVSPALVGRFFTTEPPGKPETQREGNKPPWIANVLLRNSLGTSGYRSILKSLCIILQIWGENVFTFFIFFITYKNKILCIIHSGFLLKHTHLFVLCLNCVCCLVTKVVSDSFQPHEL